MTSIAFIGGDGAGKTTVAHNVITSCGLPMKYLYMGLSTRSSNHALPTSRLVFFLKRRMYQKAAKKTTGVLPEDMPASALEYAEEKPRGWVWNAARFLNRLAEAWYRQIISTYYQLRGFVVVYDRHFFFDSAPGVVNSSDQKLQVFDQLYFWMMSHLYPRPSLTIFLDAPPDVLYARKGEASPEYLAQQRGVFLEQGKKLAHFIRVDASQPLEQVFTEVMQHVQTFYALRNPQAYKTQQKEMVERK